MRYGRGEIISTDLHGAQGLFVVVNGMVRIELSPEEEEDADGTAGGMDPAPEDHHMADVFYIGTGGVGGLTSSLLGGHMPGEQAIDVTGTWYHI